MAFDGLFLHFMKNEISDFAIGAKVDKIYMPARYELVMVLRNRTESRRLFISVGGDSPRINFTESNPENPQTPPMICMLFRKILTGAVIKSIRQQGLDRTLFIDFNATDEIGDSVERTLVIEIMAQYSNCILIDGDGIIIDSLKRVDSSKSSYREILPRFEYKLPPQQNKTNLEKQDFSCAVSRISELKNKMLSSAVLSIVSGVSPLTAKELAYRTVLGDKPVGEMSELQMYRLSSELNELSSMIKSGKCSPCYIRNDSGQPIEYSFFALTSYASYADILFSPTLSSVLDLFYVEREKLIRTKNKAEELYKTVDLLIERTSKKINNQREELLSVEEADLKRKYAELINANIYSLKKGEEKYVVEDYYDDYKTVSIPVSPELSPSENSQKYYKEYRKAVNAKKFLSQQIEKATDDLEYLQTVRDELSRAQSQGELNEIKSELSQSGFVKSKTGTKNKKNVTVPPYEFKTKNGNTVYVGKNNLQNDLLTFKKAAKTDYWFHVKKAPGSHVILSLQGKTTTEEEMEFAAKTAAWFSSLRERGSVEVDYTQVKNIKKPPASRPGYVIYHIYNTAYVKAEKPE